MRTLILRTDSFDQDNTFRVAPLKYGRCSLNKDYEKQGDGIYWVMQHSAMLKAEYSDKDREESARLMADEGIKNGDVVLIEGKQYRYEHKGNYSDCGIFHPVE
jgi:hypothetical protein